MNKELNQAIEELKKLEQQIDIDIALTKDRPLMNKFYRGLNALVKTTRKYAQKIENKEANDE